MASYINTYIYTQDVNELSSIIKMVNIKKELKSRSVEEIEDAETEIDLFDQRLGKKRVSGQPGEETN